jgi:hypothetical protein
VHVLDLCFAKEQSMNSWRSVLVSPSSSGASTVLTDPLEVIELSNSLANATVAKLGLKSSITNRFNPREFRLTEGTLRWKRPAMKANIGTTKERSLFLANPTGCDVRTVKIVEDLSVSRGPGNYRYQLIITTMDIDYETGE